MTTEYKQKPSENSDGFSISVYLQVHTENNADI